MWFGIQSYADWLFACIVLMCLVKRWNSKVVCGSVSAGKSDVVHAFPCSV